MRGRKEISNLDVRKANPERLRLNPKSFVGMGIPWTCLGIESLWSDSGHILIYEPLREMFWQFGMKSVYFLDDRFKDVFEARNRPEETGVYPIYSGTYRNVNHTKGGMLTSAAMDNHLQGRVCQVGFIFTNKRWFVPAYTLQATHHFYHYTVPVYNQPTCAGIESVDNCLASAEQIWRYRPLIANEAIGYVLARRTLFVTEAQRKRGKRLMNYYLSPSQAKDALARSVLIGGGIPPILRKYQVPDEVVAKRLKAKKSPEDFVVSYVGRFNSNKQVNVIFDMLHPLFVKYGLRFEVVTTGQIKFSHTYHFKRFGSPKDALNLVENKDQSGVKGREYYFQHVLPNIQCSVMASIFESHPSVPREIIYVGAPVMMPRRRDWATATLGDDYPFYYDDEASLMALIKRLRDGKLTDREIDAFLKVRNDVDVIQFMDYNAARMYKLFYDDFCLDVMPRIVDRHFTDVLQLVLARYRTPGEQLYWKDLIAFLRKEHNVCFGTRTKDIPLIDFAYYCYKYFDVIRPDTGLLERNTETAPV